MLSLFITGGFFFYGGKSIRRAVADIGNDVIFKRTDGLNTTRDRNKNLIEIRGKLSTYIYSFNPDYDRNILYLHGSGGSIHDREFICYLFDLMKVNYVILEYPQTLDNILTKAGVAAIKEFIDTIYEYHEQKKDILWGTSIGGIIGVALYNIDPDYKYFVHCVSSFNTYASTNINIKWGLGAYGALTPGSILKSEIPKCDRPMIVLRSKDDNYFKNQYMLLECKDNITVLHSSGIHACFNLELVYKDMSDALDLELEEITKVDWLVIETLRNTVTAFVSNFDPRKMTRK